RIQAPAERIRPPRGRTSKMRAYLATGRSIALMAALVLGLSGCLGDNCRPSRGWDNGGHHRGGGDHNCDRQRGNHERY
ncbi:MAG: hypothetical protein JWO81_1586, partial [Alphaproteobacteria bacterium]|nr:hypothetical protein [Alphaproteobacteria bacterium]